MQARLAPPTFLACFILLASVVVVEGAMSSAETPPDPDEPEPTDEEIRAAVSDWLFFTGCLLALALTVIGYGEATGAVHFFR